MVTWKIKLNKPIINLFMPNYLHVFLVISNESDKFQQTKQFVKQKVFYPGGIPCIAGGIPCIIGGTPGIIGGIPLDNMRKCDKSNIHISFSYLFGRHCS